MGVKNKIIFFTVFLFLFKNVIFLSIYLVFDPNNYIPSKKYIFLLLYRLSLVQVAIGYMGKVYTIIIILFGREIKNIYISKLNDYKDFNKLNFNAWCSAIKVQQTSFSSVSLQK